jgi:hypothetical protein
MSIQIVELVVKCRVPRDEVDEYVCRLRAGERLIPVPDELKCKDAFDLYDFEDPQIGVIRAGFGR